MAISDIISFFRFNLHAIIAIEITKYLRAPNFKKEEFPNSASLGISIADNISSFCNSVFLDPFIKSSNFKTRLPLTDNNSIDASRDNRQGTPSAAGEALHKFPPIVPKF